MSQIPGESHAGDHYSVEHPDSEQLGDGPYYGDEDEENLAELDEALGGDFDGKDGDLSAIDEELEKQMEELTNDMEQIHTSASAIPKGVMPSGAVPTDKGGRLSSHAAEFWFPESRDCTCCRGYKHGCDCVKKNRFIACQHESCYVDPAHRDQKLNEDNAPRADIGSPNASFRRSVSDGSASISKSCRFEQSPGGCRFGASCHFRHVNGGGGQGNFASGGSFNRKGNNYQRATSEGFDYYGQQGGYGNNYGNGYQQQTGQVNHSYNNQGNYSYGNNSNSGMQASSNVQQTGYSYGSSQAQNQQYPGPYQQGLYSQGAEAFPPQAPMHIKVSSPTHSSGGPSATSPTGSSDQLCTFYSKGECRYGTSCRNKHI